MTKLDLVGLITIEQFKNYFPYIYETYVNNIEQLKLCIISSSYLIEKYTKRLYQSRPIIYQTTINNNDIQLPFGPIEQLLELKINNKVYTHIPIYLENGWNIYIKYIPIIDSISSVIELAIILLTCDLLKGSNIYHNRIMELINE